MTKLVFDSKIIHTLDIDKICDYLNDYVGPDNWDFEPYYSKYPAQCALCFDTEENALLFKLRFNL